MTLQELSRHFKLRERLDRWGNSRVVEVREIPPEQIKMEVSGCGHYRGRR